MKVGGIPGPPALHTLIRILRAHVRDEPLEASLDLSSEQGWDDLIACARDHQVEPILWSPRTRCGLPKLSPKQRDAAAEACQVALRRNLLMAGELKAVLERLDDEGVPAIALKGPVMAELAYRDLALRNFVDLDVLVSPEDVSSALKVLGGMGYCALDVPLRYCEWNRQVQLFCPQKVATVELHWAVVHSYFLPELSAVDWWSPSVDCRVAGVGMRTLSMEHQAVYTCIHGAKHNWSRLKWLADLAGLLARNPNLNWEAIRRCFEEIRSPRILSLGMGLANELFDSRMPEWILSDYRSNAVVQRLRNVVVEHWIRDSGAGRHSLSGLSFASLLLPDVRRKAVLWWGAATVPTSADFRATPLPAALQPAYRFIRPLRLALKFAQRIVTGVAVH